MPPALAPLPLDVVVPAHLWEALQEHLFRPDRLEQHAFLFAGHAATPWGTRLLVRELWATPPEALEQQSGGFLRLRKAYHQRALRHSRASGLSQLEVHAHPFGERVAFSSIDTANDRCKFPYVAQRLPQIRHATLVLAPSGAVMARTWDPAVGAIVPVRELLLSGARLRRLVPDGRPPEQDDLAAPEPPADAGRYDRQVRAFGPAGQRALARLRVGVVGLGGNGARVTQDLALLGVRRFVLVDDDTLEESNLHRVVGATAADVGRPKVAVAARLVQALQPEAELLPLTCSVLEPEAVAALKGVDVLVGATDSAASRLALALLASRYLLPLVDLGLEVAGEQGRLQRCFGQVRLARADGSCLRCLGGVDPAAAGRELQTPEERALRQAAGYGTGMAGPVPALGPLNGLIAALGAFQVLALATGALAPAPYWHLDLLAPRLLGLAATRDPQCPLCGDGGEHGLGDLAPWPRFGVAHLPATIPTSELSDATVVKAC